MDNTDRWTFQQITYAVGVSKGVVHKTWVKHGLKYVKRGYFCLVEESELLRFMKEHPEFWDATKCDYYLFYQYPWFMKKLERDKKIPYEKKKYYWTDYQKQQFIIMKKRGFTHREIAEAIGKTKRAVDHHSAKMGKAVQMKSGTQNFYDGELKKMEEMPNEKAMEIGRRPPYYLQVKKNDKGKKLKQMGE